MPQILLTLKLCVARAASYGMYVILDMHQDCLTSACGAYDGVPLWLIERLPRPPRELAFPWPFSAAPPQSSWCDFFNLNLNQMFRLRFITVFVRVRESDWQNSLALASQVGRVLHVRGRALLAVSVPQRVGGRVVLGALLARDGLRVRRVREPAGLRARERAVGRQPVRRPHHYDPRCALYG